MSKFISKSSADVLKNAAMELLAGKLVAFPTETVYGLGADACNPEAVQRIYSVKGRPADHPLIVHIPSVDALGDWAQEVPGYAITLANDFWPGPMTLIMNRTQLAGDFITGGQKTVGLRVPDHPIALELLENFAAIGGKGIAAPSANRFGNVSPTTAQAVSDELKDYLDDADQILDGGACNIGLESTIIDCTRDIPQILRPGAVTIKMIVESTGLAIKTSDLISEREIRVSGSLESHYAPMAKVFLDILPVANQGFIAFADVVTPPGVVRLSSPKTEEEFARFLYAAFRAADQQGLETIIVQQPQGDGIAVAIRDRLKRSAHSG